MLSAGNTTQKQNWSYFSFYLATRASASKYDVFDSIDIRSDYEVKKMFRLRETSFRSEWLFQEEDLETRRVVHVQWKS